MARKSTTSASKFVRVRNFGSRLRLYASPAPSATQGTEEDSIIPQNITVPNGNAMNWTWYPA